MDGHFVPNLTIGAPVVKSLRQATDGFLDVHPMIDEPDRYMGDFIEAGSDMVTFHIETEKTRDRSSNRYQAGRLGGLAIRPMTPVEEICTFRCDMSRHDGGTGIWRPVLHGRTAAEDCRDP